MDLHDKTATVVNFSLARLRKAGRATAGNVKARAYPRVNPDDPLLVTLFNGMIIRTRLGDLSAHGIKLRTNRIVAEALHPSGTFIDSDSPPKTEIFLDLPLPGGELRVKARCRIARFERVFPDEVSFTLHFLTFEGAGEAVVRHYVRICLAPSAFAAHRSSKPVALDGGDAS